MNYNYINELKIVKEAANKASKTITSYAKSRAFSIEMKGKNDLVTDADLASEQEIIKNIKEYYPNDKFLAEESTPRTMLPEGRIWIIDPIDGTTNFAHGFPIYCISVALWIDGVPKVALVKEVAKGETFWAVEGQGSYLDGNKITISNIEDSSKALIGTGFPYTEFEHVDKYLSLLKSLMQKTHGLRRPGAASYDLCCTACGRFEGFFEYGLSPWDVAAGALIIKEAGGVVTDWKSESNWLFGKSIVAGNTSIHKYLLEEINEYF